MGMLTPAMTSAPTVRAIAGDGFVGGSPSMSVRMRPPRSRRPRPTASSMRARIASGCSTAVVVIASKASIVPTTLCNVLSASSAIRPCPTTTIPTIRRNPNRPPIERQIGSTFHVAMTHENAHAHRLESAAERLDQRDRAMPAAGAADGDGEIALPLALIARQREGQEVLDVLQEHPR